MKYKVADSFLSYTLPKTDDADALSGQWKRDDYVTADELKKAGFDVDFLIRNGSLEKPEGEGVEPKAAVTQKPATPAKK